MELNMMNGMRLVINVILSPPMGLYWNYIVVFRQEFHSISQPA